MRRIAIVIDGEAVAAPTVREKIAGGSAVIAGSFNQREAHELANLLNNPLHTRIRIINQQPFGR
jgi:preprotein translocase subunit SecD